MADVLHPKLNEYGAMSLDSPETLYYGSFRGSPELRSAIANLFNRKLNPAQLLIPANVAVGNGAGAIINMLGQIMADPGEGILIPSPVYGAFHFDLGSIGRVKSVFVEAPAAQPSLDQLEAARAKAESEGTCVRAFLITNPGNPTGQVLPRATLRAWLRWAHAKGLQVIMDEVYALSVWGNVGEDGFEGFESVLEMDDIPDRTSVHVVWSFSKDFCMSGMRAACLISYDSDVLAGMSNLSYFHGIPRVVDEALVRLLKDEAFVDQFLETSKQRIREQYARVKTLLTKRNVRFLAAHAGIFVYMDLRPWTSRLAPGRGSSSGKPRPVSMVLFEKFLSAGLYVTPSDAFFAQDEPGWFRMITTTPWDVVEVAMERMFSVLDDVEKVH